MKGKSAAISTDVYLGHPNGIVLKAQSGRTFHH